MSRERQKQQSEEVRSRIIEIARRIITEEGIDALSIRRITKEMDYSAGIIYHYFENKEQILSCVMQEGYKRILASIQPASGLLPPDESIRVSFTNYIESALNWPIEYKAVMLNSSAQVLGFTSILGEGVCENRPALMMLAKDLESGITSGLFAPCDTQLTAQAIWSAMFGLLTRLIIEQNVSEEQRKKLIERQIDIIIRGLRK